MKEKEAILWIEADRSRRRVHKTVGYFVDRAKEASKAIDEPDLDQTSSKHKKAIAAKHRALKYVAQMKAKVSESQKKFLKRTQKTNNENL